MKNLLKSVVLASGILLTANAVNAQQKIGHINTAEIIESTSDYKNANDQLQKLKNDKDTVLKGLYVEYQKKQTEANEKARTISEANKSVVEPEIQKLVGELRNMEQTIQQNTEAAQEEIGKKQQELYNPIQIKLNNAIQAVAKEKGYAYILDISMGSVPYFAGGDDLSADVKAKLGVSASAAATKPATGAKK